jgi:hypothetical protein
MKTSLLAALAILMPFAFKVIQVLKDDKKHLKRIKERYKQFLRYKARKIRAIKNNLYINRSRSKII